MIFSVILIGETGSGKSSVINLLGNHALARVSPDVEGCTKTFEHYTVNLGTLQVRMIDTVGFSPASTKQTNTLDPFEKACELIHSLKDRVDALFLCTGGSKLTPVTRKIYTLFREFFFDGIVPVALVVTRREYEKCMEDWWTRNKADIEKSNLHFVGHACITAWDVEGDQREQSKILLKELIRRVAFSSHQPTSDRISESAGEPDCHVHRPIIPLQDRFARAKDILTNDCGIDGNALERKIRRSFLRITNVIIFGETGVGKSSVVNLLAGMKLADVSSGAAGCTLQCDEYRVTVEGTHLRMFDTIGLNGAKMERGDYVSAIQKAYELVDALERAGGVDLLLLCMRGGRLTETIQNNYKLFHEFLCNKKVPIAVVITYLEDEDCMEDWWKDNEKHFSNSNIHVDGHACVTATKNRAAHESKLMESRRLILELINQYSVSSPQEMFVVDKDERLLSFAKRIGDIVLGGKIPRKRAVVDLLIKNC
ncbi:P-loop containing nucleoside triphosphate hydrolase protein [Phlebopus sp. FC_14]|nr:P-loop containing nucleoside triphosphate hydrolase protein [Phlebopus sp. FC_14]